VQRERPAILAAKMGSPDAHDVRIPTTDGRMLLLQRCMHLETELQLLLERL